MRKLTDFKQYFRIEDVRNMENSTFFIGEEEFLIEEDLEDDFESFMNYHFDFELPDAGFNVLYRYEWYEIERWLDMDSKGYAMAKY